MAPGDPLDEFDSERATTETPGRLVPFDAPPRPPAGARPLIETVEPRAGVKDANASSRAASPVGTDDALPDESGSAPPPLAGAPGAPTTAPLHSLEEILRREVAINWDEAVAVVEEVCALLSPVETGVPGPSDLFIADNTVVRRDRARAESDVTSAGRLLHSLLSTAGSTPVPLRLFVTQANAQGTYASIAAFSKALAYFGKPGRRELIRALYLRCASAASSLPATVRPAEPKRDAPPASTPQPARSRRSVPRWAVAAFAVIVLPAAVVWVWSMRSRFAGDTMLPSLVAQAREAVGRLGIGSPAEQAASATPAAAPPALRRDAGTGSRVGSLATDAPRLVSRALASADEVRPRSRRRPRPLMPVLVQSPPSAELSARNADETEREAITLAIYSGRDADVEPPVLLLPTDPHEPDARRRKPVEHHGAAHLRDWLGRAGAPGRRAEPPSRCDAVERRQGLALQARLARRRCRALSRARQLGRDAMNIVWTGSHLTVTDCQ